MDSNQRTPVWAWIVIVLAILLVLPLLAMFVMMVAGSAVMGAHMGGMMPMHGWGLAWLIVAATVVGLVLVVVVRAARRG